MAILDDVKVALRISSGTTAYDTEIVDLIEAAEADLVLAGVLSEKVTGTATVATLTLSNVLAGQTVAINGYIFTAHANTTTAASRQFKIDGNDGADAAALAGLINDATYGVPGVTAAAVGNVITLSATITVCGTEIVVTVSAATVTVVLADVVEYVDPLIRRAITTYCKANFGWDNPDAERLQKAYDLLKMHLTLASDYNSYAVTFLVKDSVTLAAIRSAEVTFNGVAKTTDATGQAVFYVRAGSNYEYTVTAEGYEADEDESNLVDVAASQTVNIALVEV